MVDIQYLGEEFIRTQRGRCIAIFKEGERIESGIRCAISRPEAGRAGGGQSGRGICSIKVNEIVIYGRQRRRAWTLTMYMCGYGVRSAERIRVMVIKLEVEIIALGEGESALWGGKYGCDRGVPVVRI